MSLTADIIAYLTSIGQIDEINWKSNIGIDPMPPRVSSAQQVIAVQDTSGEAADTHTDDNRNQGFRLLVRGKQHDYEMIRTKFYAVLDALQDQAEAITADANTTEEFLFIHSPDGGPLVSSDKGDRIHMTTTFSVKLAKV